MKNRKIVKQDEPVGFSLALGGPLYNLFIRTGLAKPPLKRGLWRIAVIVMITWLPLLILSIINGTAFGNAGLPFIFDFAAHARFLISLTLLMAAEMIVHAQLQDIVQQFIDRNIICQENRETFNKIINFCMGLRNSIVAEVLLLVFVLIVGPWFFWSEFSALNIATWYAKLTNQGTEITSAGYWYIYISLPIFQFILLRWYFRLFIWYLFLWQVSRLPLNLNALHPDKSGGIGFLAYSIFAFSPILLAHTVLLAGIIANHLWYAGEKLLEFKWELLGILFYLLIVVILPLTFFVAQLVYAKRNGILAYGVTGSHYVNDFRDKWISANAKPNAPLLGTPDIQSLADLSNSFDVNNQMSILPLNRMIVLQLILVLAIPFFPLVLTMVPLDAMINGIIKIIL